MEKRIPVTDVAYAVSTVIFERRRPNFLHCMSLMDKEINRYVSMVEPVVIEQKAGDPGAQNLYHGCEARGI